MGSLSRNFDGWRNQVHMNARNLGPGGQMATLMHGELESISHHTRQMNDAVGHLAWVQQQAHQEQLSAQYRVMQLQSETIGELGRANETLALVSSQLAEVADILRDLKDTQDEHLQIVKAERTLKEVLFQLSTMLEDMIIPEDEVARLCLCQVALDSLDHHGLNTSHLSDLADKREFAAFVKKTRQTVRNTPHELQADLLAFEVWYKGYTEGRIATPPSFATLPAPPWQPRPAPQRKSKKGPTWEERPEPSLQLRTLRPRPAEHAHPGDHPLPQQFGPMPNQIYVGAELVSYPYQQVAPATFTPDTVPSAEDTQTRLPNKGRGFMQFLDSMFCSEEWANARKFEEALRSWAQGVKRYEAYVKDVAAWTAEEIAIAKVNEEIERIHHPAELEEFRVAEAERRRQYEVDRLAFEAKEEQRRAAYDREVALHEEQEKQRHVAWEEEILAHAAEEEKRLEQWKTGIDDFASTLRRQGKTINEFLEEHPDIQLLYSNVDWQKDADEVLRRVREKRELPLVEPPPSDQWQNNSQYAHKLLKQAVLTAKSVEEGEGLQRLVDKMFSVLWDQESPDVGFMEAWRIRHPEARSGLPGRISVLEEAIRSDWHHAQLGESNAYWHLRAAFHAFAGNLRPYEALQLYNKAKDVSREGHHEAKTRFYLQSHVKDPQFLWAANDYAWELATSREVSQRNGVVAVKYALQVCERSQWHCWSFIDTLAAAYAQCGEAESAVACARRALQLCPPEEEVDVSRCIALYETGKSYPLAVSERKSLGGD